MDAKLKFYDRPEAALLKSWVEQCYLFTALLDFNVSLTRERLPQAVG